MLFQVLDVPIRPGYWDAQFPSRGAYSLLAGWLLCLLPGSAWGQNTGSLTGVVRDRATQELLPGVTVRLEGTALGTATDGTGRYRLSAVPAGSYNL